MGQAGIPWTQVATACIASAAFVLSIVGLVIQYRTWVTAGARIKGAWKHGLLVGPATGLFGPPGKLVRVISIELTNTGRIAGEVQQVTFERATGRKRPHFYVPVERWLTGEPSGEVRAHSTRTWHVLEAPLVDMAGRFAQVRPRVLLGDGTVLRLKRIDLASISAVSRETGS